MKTRTLISSLLASTLAVLASCSSSDAEAGVSLSGSGASFPEPLYSTWFKEYHTAHKTRVTYTSKGSSGGINDTINKLVDFGASDAAMKDSEIAKVEGGIKMLPMTAGGLALIYNLPGVDDLALSREALVGIYLGTIRSWNDPKIASHNPGKTLPADTIAVVRRSDGSGTTYAFTNHLSAISPEWKAGPGVSKNPNWPRDANTVGGNKNDGVASQVKNTPGAIGYVEMSFAKGFQLARLQNKAGEFVAPSIASFQAALAGSTLPSNMRVFLPDPDGKDAYPIVTYTWILAYPKYPAAKAKTLKKVLKWCLTDGQEMSEDLGYVPLPKVVTDQVIAAVDSIQAVDS